MTVIGEYMQTIIKYFYNCNKEKIETKKRQEELVEIIEKLKKIELFPNEKAKTVIKFESKKSSEESFEEIFDRIIHIDLKKGPNKKIDIINMLNIEKMNLGQLQNTYKCVRKSIEVETKKNNQKEIEKLKKLKKAIKKEIISKNEKFSLDYIKNNLKFAKITDLDIYENYLNGLFNNANSKKDKIEILLVIKLINKIKNQKNEQLIKKIR